MRSKHAGYSEIESSEPSAAKRGHSTARYLGHLTRSMTIAHKALDHELELLSTMLTAERYRAVLCRFYGVNAPIEALLFAAHAWPSASLNREPRRKAHLLRADLQGLDIEASDVPLCDELSDLPTLSEGPGCLYVIEGAALGGHIICRRLREHLDLSEDTGGNLFTGYGEGTGQMWREFCQELKARADTPEIQDAVVRGALSTFRTLLTWIQREDVR